MPQVLAVAALLLAFVTNCNGQGMASENTVIPTSTLGYTVVVAGLLLFLTGLFMLLHAIRVVMRGKKLLMEKSQRLSNETFGNHKHNRRLSSDWNLLGRLSRRGSSEPVGQEKLKHSESQSTMAALQVFDIRQPEMVIDETAAVGHASNPVSSNYSSYSDGELTYSSTYRLVGRVQGCTSDFGPPSSSTTTQLSSSSSDDSYNVAYPSTAAVANVATSPMFPITCQPSVFPLYNEADCLAGTSNGSMASASIPESVSVRDSSIPSVSSGLTLPPLARANKADTLNTYVPMLSPTSQPAALPSYNRMKRSASDADAQILEVAAQTLATPRLSVASQLPASPSYNSLKRSASDPDAQVLEVAAQPLVVPGLSSAAQLPSSTSYNSLNRSASDSDAQVLEVIAKEPSTCGALSSTSLLPLSSTYNKLNHPAVESDAQVTDLAKNVFAAKCDGQIPSSPLQNFESSRYQVYGPLGKQDVGIPDVVIQAPTVKERAHVLSLSCVPPTDEDVSATSEYDL